MSKPCPVPAQASADTLPLSVDEWAVICTLHQEPDYLFRDSEYRLAQRMAGKGLLTEQAKRRFIATELGERSYRLR